MIAHDLAMALDPVVLMQHLGLTPDPWQAALLRENATHAQSLLLCARQTGKSSTTAVLALHEALYRPKSLVLMASPSLRQSQELYLKLTTFYNDLGQPIPATEMSSLRLTLANGSRVVALPSSEATIRGFSAVSLLLLDEASRISDTFYAGVRPFLAVSGGRLIAMSTPWGQRGWFWDAWEHGGPGWYRTKVTAYDCPRISPAFLESERLALGDWAYKQEYECSFEQTTDSVFSAESINDAFVDDLPPLFAEEMFA